MTDKEGLVIVPISNFHSNTEIIKLNDSLCIRRTRAFELEELMKRSVDYYVNLKQALTDVEFVIEKKVISRGGKKLDWVDWFSWRENSTNMQNIVLTLRLLKEGYIDLKTAFFVSSNSFYISNTAPLYYDYEEPFVLSTENSEDVVRLWNKLQNVEKENLSLKFSLDQFSKSFNEQYAENGIVDLMTAFESVVFSKEKNAPRPYGKVIGIAIGMLLGRSRTERGKIRDELEDAYSLRNKIVHGHLRDIDTIDTVYVIDEVWASKIREYLRRTLKILLEEVKT